MSRAWSHCPTKLPDELRRPRVGEHPIDLGRQVRAELVLAGEAEQLVVGHRRPEEVRQPRGQGVFVDRRDTGPARPARPPPRGRGTGARPARPPSPGRRPPRRSAPPGTRRPRRAPPSRSSVASSTGRRKALVGEPAQELAGVRAGVRRRRRARRRGRSARSPAAGPSTARPAARGGSPTGCGAPATGPASRPA